MARRHIDPVEVVRSGGEPARFLWHDRLYVVRDVLGHWVENEEWWHAGHTNRTNANSNAGSNRNAGSNAHAHSNVNSDVSAGAAGGGTALLAAEREVWRVEAAAGRSAPLGVFDLRLDAQGAWTLARTLD